MESLRTAVCGVRAGRWPAVSRIGTMRRAARNRMCCRIRRVMANAFRSDKATEAVQGMERPILRLSGSVQVKILEEPRRLHAGGAGAVLGQNVTRVHSGSTDCTPPGIDDRSRAGR